MENINIIKNKNINKFDENNLKNKKFLKEIFIENKNANKDLPKNEELPKGIIIKMEGVHKLYGNKKFATHILKGIDLEIKKGEFVAILGKSGSGKTTMMNIMSGLVRPTFGKVVTSSFSLKALSNKELVKFRKIHTGFVFQSYNLIPELTAFENAETGAQLQDAEKRLDIKDFYKTIDMADQMYKFPSELSGGQQQRVSIARALTKNPDILFADEPTGALDEKSTEQVFKLLRQINKKYKTTIIMVTHNPQLTKNVNTIINVRDGRIESIKTRR
jgi:putative ABC transport system ATP-binding protein